MAYDGAYTLWPGIAHVEHFRLRNQSRAIQWNLEVEEADVTIDLPALFDKKFHAYRTRASGVAFRLRRKLDDDHAATARAAAAAPIEGYDNPPLAPIGPPQAPMTDANYDEWRVAMEDVDAAVSEVWIDEWRWLGGGHVIGGFYMKPERLLQVGPCSIDVHQGQFQVGGRPALTEIDAHIDALIDALDFRVPIEVGVRSISARGRFGGNVPNLDFIRLYLPRDSPIHVEEGGGDLHTYFHMANGRILPATRLDVKSDHLILGAGKFEAAVAFEAEAHVDAGARGPTASGEIHVREATIARIGADGASPRIEDARAHFIGLPRDLAGPFAIERTDLDVPAKFPDLRWLLQTPENGNPPPTDVSGAATLRARVSIDREALAAGTVEAQSDHVALTTKAFALSARLHANVGFYDGNLDTKSVVFGPSSLVAGDLAIAKGGRNHPGGQARVDVSEGRVEEGSPYSFALTVGATLRDFGWLSIRDDKNRKRGAKASAGNLRGSFIVLRPAALFDKSGINPGITGQVSAGLAAVGQFDDVALRGSVTASALVDGIDPGNDVFHFRNIQVVASNVEVRSRERSHARMVGPFQRAPLRRLRRASSTNRRASRGPLQRRRAVPRGVGERGDHPRLGRRHLSDEWPHRFGRF